MSENKAGCQLAARYGAYDDYDDDYYKLRSIHSTTRHYIYCYAYALPNSNSQNNSEGEVRGVNKERAGHSGKYLNLFTSDRKQSRRFRMECILQIDSNDRVGVNFVDGYRWGGDREGKGDRIV